MLPSIAAASFSDVASDHQYYDSIIYLQENEIVIGYPDGTFKPDQGVTRAEMMKIITLSAFDDEEIGDGEDCFPDVNAEWYARFVCYGQDNDIIKGYPDGSFQPNNNVTIAE